MKIEELIQKTIETRSWRVMHGKLKSVKPDPYCSGLYLADWGLAHEPEKIWLRDILLEKKFWQALGEALEWGEDIGQVGYINEWHAFISHLAEGGEIEEYLEQL